VRYGVAPDHVGTKDVAKLFKKTASRKGFTFHLNTEIGSHLTHDELAQHVHAIVYAVGAPHDRNLDIPGEDLRGSASATDFVAWYNGHPNAAHLTFDLSAEHAVVVGNGNVALDVARILLSDPDELARTDIADHALTALRESNVQEVLVVGRRGPAQAAFTTPELLGLRSARGFRLLADPVETAVDDATRQLWRDAPDPIAAMKTRLIADLGSAGEAGRALRLRFAWSPVQVLGQDRVTGIRLRRNSLAYQAGAVVAVPTDETVDLDCGLVLRAVGYQGAPVRGLPFDEVTRTVPHTRGRVSPGTYVAGWVKRGPSGVIGTNKWDAAETVRSLLEDRDALSEPSRSTEELLVLLEARCPRRMSGKDWLTLDAHERFLAKGTGRPRVKLTDVEAMLDVVKQART
jgi:ferredoxin--NADP+ reductase